MVTTNIGERIRACRDRLGLSQRELATRMGRDQVTLSRWELGKAVPSASALGDLSSALGVTTDYLLGVSAPGTGTGG